MTLRVAIAGAGMIAPYHLRAWQTQGARARVVALCDPDPLRARAMAAEFAIPATFADADALFAHERIDALDVASPRETHAAWVRAAAARGVAVLCQKPLAPTFDEAQRLVDDVGGRVRFMVHENWRFRPWYRELRRWIDDGVLGVPSLVRMVVLSSGALRDAQGHRPAFVRQPFLAGERRLLMMETLIHHLDVLRMLCGPLRVVAAQAGRTLPDVPGDTVAAILLATAGGAPVEVVGSMVAPGYPARTMDRLELVGTRASALFADNVLRLMDAAGAMHDEAYDLEAAYQASFDHAIAHFLDALMRDAPFETEAADNLLTLRLVEEAYRLSGVEATMR